MKYKLVKITYVLSFEAIYLKHSFKQSRQLSAFLPTPRNPAMPTRFSQICYRTAVPVGLLPMPDPQTSIQVELPALQERHQHVSCKLS